MLTQVSIEIPVQLTNLPYIRVWHSQYGCPRGQAVLSSSSRHGDSPKSINVNAVEVIANKVSVLVRRGKVVLVPVSVEGCVGWSAYILPD